MNFAFLIFLTGSIGLLGCQSIPLEKVSNTDVCIGDPVAVEPDQEVDLEEMAKQIDCP